MINVIESYCEVNCIFGILYYDTKVRLKYILLKGMEKVENHFYHFLKPISQELTRILEELERAIYQSPRFMITHSRTLIEAIMEKVMIHENIPSEEKMQVIDRIRALDQEGLLTNDLKHALHEVRKLGNAAAHQTREFRFSESLITWERIYHIVKWFVEVYGSHQLEVPAYEDPKMKLVSYDLEELSIRMERFETLLQQSIERETSKEDSEAKIIHNNKVSEEEVKEDEADEEATIIDRAPGLTPVRTITFKNEALAIPHFLRDAFLLPQRFPE